MKTVSIIPGRNAVSNEYASGRRIVRNWGGIPADEIIVQLRIMSAEEPVFNYFWHRIGLDGTWFTADWLTSMGYTNCKARFLGYPKRKGVTKSMMDFSFALLVQDSSLCVDYDAWPSEASGEAPPGPPTWPTPLVCFVWANVDPGNSILRNVTNELTTIGMPTINVGTSLITE
jgi:hypothetical protein